MSQRTVLHVESTSPSFSSSRYPASKNTRAPEGALAGAGICIVVTGAIGWLAGIGVLALPGIDHLTDNGPGLAALCGIVVGATIGGIAGCLAGGRMRDNRVAPLPCEEWVIISVRARDARAAARAGTIMNAAGATSISMPDPARNGQSPSMC